jgi:hypothetical protein
MRQREDNERRAGALGARQPVRKPYRKPTVRYERVFEVQALTCGKVQTTQGSCHYNRRSS